MKKHLKEQKGITLIALIITIIILLILAMVSIRIVLNENILTHAETAATQYVIEQEREKIQLAFADYKMGAYLSSSPTFAVEGANVSANGTDGWVIEFPTGNKYDLSKAGVVTPVNPEGPADPEEPVNPDITITNPETNPEGWKYAFVCRNGAWDSTPLVDGTGLTGTGNGVVVAKFYEAKDASGNPVAPVTPLPVQGVPLDEGPAYNLVIEGNGSMGPLLTTEGGNIKGANAWQAQTMAHLYDKTLPCVMPYVLNVTVCEGVTNIGEYAFAMNGITSITIDDSVTSIDRCAFQSCSKLKSITIPSTVTTIGNNAFQYSGLESITIPSSVTSIGECAFQDCPSLATVNIEAVPESFTVGADAFLGLKNPSTIYVPNNNNHINTALSGKYSSQTSVVSR